MVSMLYDAFLDEEMFSVVKTITEISSERIGQNICPGSDPNSLPF